MYLSIAQWVPIQAHVWVDDIIILHVTDLSTYWLHTSGLHELDVRQQRYSGGLYMYVLMSIDNNV